MNSRLFNKPSAVPKVVIFVFVLVLFWIGSNNCNPPMGNTSIIQAVDGAETLLSGPREKESVNSGPDLQKKTDRQLYELLKEIKAKHDHSDAERAFNPKEVPVYQEFHRRVKYLYLPSYPPEPTGENFASRPDYPFIYRIDDSKDDVDLLLAAVYAQDLPRIKKLKEAGCAKAGLQNKTALLLAIDLNSYELVDYLLDNYPCRFGSSTYTLINHITFESLGDSRPLLCQAAKYGNLAIFKRVLKAYMKKLNQPDEWIDARSKCNREYLTFFDADFFRVSEWIFRPWYDLQQQPLVYAVQSNNMEVIEFIVDTGMQDAGTAIPIAIDKRDAKTLAYLLNHAENLEWECFTNTKHDPQNENGIHAFIRQNNLKGVQLLVQKGLRIIDVDLGFWCAYDDCTAVTQNDTSYLYYTILYTDNVEMFRFFYEYPQEKISKSTNRFPVTYMSKERMALQLAKHYRRGKILEYLCEKHKDILTQEQYDKLMKKAVEFNSNSETNDEEGTSPKDSAEEKYINEQEMYRRALRL